MTTTTALKSQTRRRVGIYVRISSDPDGTKLAVQRQEKACRSRARQKDWTVVEVYCDNDISAAGDVERPAYQRMLADIKSGKIDGIVAWAFDRLTRSMRELEDIIELHEQHGAELATIEGEIDLSTDVGRMIARILAAVARQELERRRRRQLEERTQKAELGVLHGGGKRPYGYEDDRVTIRESEAELIREAADRVLDGESIRSLVNDFAARPDGVTMTPTRLRTILISARISGRREHWQGKKGERRPALAPIVGTANWEPIISVEQSDALRALLTASSRTTNVTKSARKHLLPGFLQCSQCEQPMQSASLQGRAGYACAAKPNGSKCRKAIFVDRADETVVAKLLEVIDTPKFRKLADERAGISPKLRVQLRKDEARLIELAELEESGELTPAEWKAKRDVVLARIIDVKMIIDRSVQHAALHKLLEHDDIAAGWALLSLAQQRSVLDSAIKRVVIHPPKKMGSVFDPTRVEVRWAA